MVVIVQNLHGFRGRETRDGKHAMKLDKTIAGTKRLTPEELSELSPQRSAVSLLVYHAEGTSSHALLEGCPLVVGRHASLAIPDSSLSREHARFELIDAEVWVEDLGSTNGTRVNGAMVSERQRLNAGDEVLLGSVCVSIHSLERAHVADGLESHEGFGRLLEHEARRCRGLGGALALLMIEHVGDSPLGRWFPTLRSALRPMDVAGAYSSHIVEVLLPGASARLAGDMAAQLMGELGHEFRCGVAGYPWAGSSADELLGVCLQAAHRCTADRPIYPSPKRGETEPEPGVKAEAPVVLSPKMRELYRVAQHVARSDIAVLIHGETGAGKELVARAIHHGSPRKERKLLCLNCGAIPEQLVESALFGHERGAFSGADQRRPGVFERAAGGTVFLDEIGELSASAQVALLRVLEQKRLTRVGGADEVPIDVRVVAATHQDLQAMCEAKTFRLDLLYRLNAMVLELPPLRERREELEALARHFLILANRQNQRQISGFSSEALEALRQHGWPGNVRELRNVVERAVVIAAGSAITLEDLPAALRRLGPAPKPAATAEEALDDAELFETELDFKAAYCACDRNKAETSRRLRIPLRTLINKLQHYDLEG
ncbi:MAG: sigma 54-interacting transcriptional regulator [Deltaproteobacteria bacterium]|nr:sigma 54-interacting transcriptional regulator [Deltaproteobacteria bacterium]